MRPNLYKFVCAVLCISLFLISFSLAANAEKSGGSKELAPGVSEKDARFIDEAVAKRHFAETIKGLKLMHESKYDESFATFRSIIKAEPEHPLGYFLYCVAIERKMFDYKDFSLEKEFLENIKKAVDTATKVYNKNPNDAWSNFYMGLSRGTRALYAHDFGNFFGSFIDGLMAGRYMNKAFKMDEHLIDARYGIDLWQYWSNYYIRLIGSEKKRNSAIDDLRGVAKDGIYTKLGAQSSLVEIFFVEKRYDEGQALINEVLKHFNDNLHLRWYQAKGYVRSEDWEKARNAYLWLQDYFSKREGSNNGLALIDIRTRLADISFHLGKNDEAQKFVDLAFKDLNAKADEGSPEGEEKHFMSDIRKTLQKIQNSIK